MSRIEDYLFHHAQALDAMTARAEAAEARRIKLQAENAHFSKQICSGVLGALLEAAAEIRSLREQVARARLEGMEIMRAEAERAVEDATNTDWDDCCLDVMGDAVQAIQNLDTAAILEAHTRAEATGTLGDSDGDDGA